MRLAMIAFIVAASLAPGFAQGKPAPLNVQKTSAKSAPARAAIRPGPSPDEQTIFDSANRERATHQLPLLKWNTGLAAAARQHAQKMAQEGKLAHEFPGEAGMGMRIRMAGVNFVSVAENVAQAPSARMLHQEWMDSPPHRANILDPEMDSLGVAVVQRNGELFAVQDFALAAQ
jgi:uncharacterized protein YkwD